MSALNSNQSLKKQISLRDFFKNPEKTGYTISPDGKYLAYLAPYENRLNIFVQKISSGDPVRVTGVTERDIANYFWKGNNRIIYLKDKNGDENFHLFSVDIEGNNHKDLTPFENVRANVIDELEENDSEILVGLNKKNMEVFDAYRLNAETGELVLSAENPGNISGWVTDHDGRIRVAVTTDGVNNSVLYREDERSPFRTILTNTFKESLIPLFFTFDNNYVYAASNINRDKSVIIKYDIANGKELELLFEHPEVDVSSLGFSKKRKVLTTITFTTWKNERVFLDDEIKNIYERLTKELNGYEIFISSINKDEDKFIIRTYSDRSLGAYYFYDKTSDDLKKIADVSPWIDENDLAEMKPVSYISRDGLTINGYLTLPKNTDAKDLPIVVNVHGGPWVRDAWVYNPEVQFLANRGYAVLQVNYRGSTGYGKTFWEKSFKQWGRTMQDDLTDGVNWLIEQGIANAKRVAIYGGSYGGYATLAGLTFTPDVYACGVDYVGVSNLFTFMKSIPPYWKPYLEMLYELVGNPETEKELMEAASPVFHVDKIKVPLFIAQGRMDPRVNVNESDQMVEALKKRGIEVPYMVKDNEGHGFHNEENKFDFYEAMEKFLAKHLLN